MAIKNAHLVTESLTALAPAVPGVTSRFYARLFATHPGLRSLFPADVTRQGQHLAVAVAMVARNADRLADLEEPLRELGARHVRYGAERAHYAVVRDLLLETLAEAAGTLWIGPLAEAWAEVLHRVCELMIEGADMSVMESRNAPAAQGAGGA